MNEENDILERLRHPEREAERRRPSRDLYLRNVLNSIFIIVALVAMVGILIANIQGTSTRWCLIVGLIAVLIKMLEVMIRMPHMLRKNTPRRPSRLTATAAAMAATAEAPAASAEAPAEAPKEAPAEAEAEK